MDVEVIEQSQVERGEVGHGRQRRLVERTSGPGRVVRLVMTDAGRSLLEEGRGLVDDVLDTTVGHLSQRELEQLGDLLTRILDGVSAG